MQACPLQRAATPVLCPSSVIVMGALVESAELVQLNEVGPFFFVALAL